MMNSKPTKHEIKIAKQTVNMPSAMVDIMGGMSKKKARKILRSK